LADNKNQDPNRDAHVTRETHVEKSSGSGMAFILGGVVVAVLVIAYVLFGMGGGDIASDGGGTDATTEAPASGAGGSAPDGGGEPAADGGGGTAEPAN